MSNTKRNIETILDLPGNRKCADCASLVDQDTGWASLNLGVVMCIQCAGIHRAMGTHITKIRSFRLDTNAWTDKITSIFTTIGGNDRANHAVWESNLPSFWINPKQDKGSETIRKEFIRTKYEKQAFLPPDQLRGRVNNCVKKMPIEVRQIVCDFWCRGDKKYKNNQFAVIHSRWFSRYTGCKRAKAAQQIDLTNFNIIIEENTTGFEDYDGYEFSLYEDTKYIVDNTKELDLYNGQNEHKSIPKQKSNDSPINHVFAHDEPLLRCRVKDFKKFVNTVKDIRSTTAYYRVYDSLFEIEPDDPPLNITSQDIKSGKYKMLGFGKIGWSKRYFCVLNGFLYQFKENISQTEGVMPQAMCAWDLQLIDCVLDENGKRSGSKFAVLIINGAKTISVKFSSGPDAVMFYSILKQCWTDARGKYFVNFSIDPPEISGEANGPQPIHNEMHQNYVKKRHQSSFYMPNPDDGRSLLPAPEQDALILNLIDEYVEKQRLKSQVSYALDSSMADVSYSCDEDDDFESTQFEISETDPSYRQIKRDSIRNNNNLAAANKLDILHMESEEQSIDTDSCFTEHELTVQSLSPPNEAQQRQQLDDAMAIEQQLTIANNNNAMNGYHDKKTQVIHNRTGTALEIKSVEYDSEAGHQEDEVEHEIEPEPGQQQEEAGIIETVSSSKPSSPIVRLPKPPPRQSVKLQEIPLQQEMKVHIAHFEDIVEAEEEKDMELEIAPVLDVEIVMDQRLVLEDNRSSSPLSPPMSHTQQTQESENIAIEIKPAAKEEKEAKAQMQNIVISPVESTGSKTSSKIGTRHGINTPNSVASRVSIFNQKNDEVIRKKSMQGYIGRPKSIPRTTRQTSANSPVNLSPDTVPIEKYRKKRRKKRSAKRKKKAKPEPPNIKMAHLNITRWFNIDQAQTSKLSNPSFRNIAQQTVAKWAILSIMKDKRYIKVQISRRIPLPQRQQHWNKTIEALQSRIGGRSLSENETIIND